MATDTFPNTRFAIPEELFEGNRLDQSTFHRLYEQTPEDFKAELIGGVVHVASPVGTFHSDCHSLAIAWLRGYSGSMPGVRPLLDATVVLGEASEPQPDGGLRYEEGTSVDRDNYCVGPPELIVEVSRSTVTQDLIHKHDDYERNGVGEYLILVIPDSRVIWFVRREDNHYVELLPTDGILRSRAFPGLWLDPEAFFRDDYKRVMAVLGEGLASVEKSA